MVQVKLIYSSQWMLKVGYTVASNLEFQENVNLKKGVTYGSRK